MISLRWTAIGDEGLAILGGLATIALVIMAAGWFFAGYRSLMTFLFTGCQFAFLIMLVTELHIIMGMFVNTFVWAGLQIGGGQLSPEQFLTPSLIFSAGEQASTPIMLHIEHLRGYFSSVANAWIIWMYSVFLLVIWACYWLMAVHIVLAVVQVQIMGAMSLLLIPWAAFSATASIGHRAIGQLLSAIIRLGFLAAVTSLSVPVYALIASPSIDVSHWQTALAIPVGAAILAVLNWTAPSLGARFIGGGDLITLGIGFVWGAMRLRGRRS